MASTNGNSLGPRNWYRYTDDGGAPFAVFLDADLANAGGFQAYDGDADDPIASTYLELRFVNGKRDNGQRKRIPVATRTNPVYAAATSTNVTVDGVVFAISSRIGEKRQFAFNQGTSDPD
jgi:hypothetical protein